MIFSKPLKLLLILLQHIICTPFFLLRSALITDRIDVSNSRTMMHQISRYAHAKLNNENTAAVASSNNIIAVANRSRRTILIIQQLALLIQFFVSVTTQIYLVNRFSVPECHVYGKVDLTCGSYVLTGFRTFMNYVFAALDQGTGGSAIGKGLLVAVGAIYGLALYYAGWYDVSESRGWGCMGVGAGGHVFMFLAEYLTIRIAGIPPMGMVSSRVVNGGWEGRGRPEGELSWLAALDKRDRKAVRDVVEGFGVVDGGRDLIHAGMSEKLGRAVQERIDGESGSHVG